MCVAHGVLRRPKMVVGFANGQQQIGVKKLKEIEIVDQHEAKVNCSVHLCLYVVTECS